jgi:uncharacterized membrane protein
MSKGRIEAFSDGVLAIILTIMVLEIKVPHGDDLHALAPLIPLFFSYLLSFVYVGIYWNNHHHLLRAARSISGGVMWANLHLLFWLSLVPVVTGWVGEHPSAPWPAACYGVVLLLAALAWLILQRSLIAQDGRDSALARAVGRDRKGKASAALYSTGVLLAFVRPWLSYVSYAIVALIWLIPDRRIEEKIAGAEGGREAE